MTVTQAIVSLIFPHAITYLASRATLLGCTYHQYSCRCPLARRSPVRVQWTRTAKGTRAELIALSTPIPFTTPVQVWVGSVPQSRARG
jgi:hypothetical protein